MTAPLTFEPLFMERVWGGRRLQELFGKALPDGATIGESWELVDRPEAQSVVATGPLTGTTLGELWRGPDRERLFGTRARDAGERFPLLVKLLDCVETLSVQVHPPADVACRLGGEPKTEMWVVLATEGDAHLLVGLREGVTREAFEQALRDGDDVSALLHRVGTAPGMAMLLPSGRVHAIGAGNVIAEVQQNSDTTYRVFDFDRPGLDGAPRELHVDESLASIDFDDAEPSPVRPDGEALVHHALFEVDRLVLDGPRRAAPAGECAVVCGLDAPVRTGADEHLPGTFVLVPADAEDPDVAPAGERATVLRILLGP
ncbi:type I phosphomannose isomerase catalytic subunit [Conexibacter sp. SYSU D00693]|uniref:type I phosphomannose isomerase catalytic subunit n=1 Tax=Conexibacter sp. SYSU D00693 TaxID=2812560 RepID=UPI00196AB003|nr:type I phosphomannose isomerase catalytic subunit [Conexibacter sp. SYSU D00693]